MQHPQEDERVYVPWWHAIYESFCAGGPPMLIRTLAVAPQRDFLDYDWVWRTTRGIDPRLMPFLEYLRREIVHRERLLDQIESRT